MALTITINKLKLNIRLELNTHIHTLLTFRRMEAFQRQ